MILIVVVVIAIVIAIFMWKRKIKYNIVGSSNESTTGFPMTEMVVVDDTEELLEEDEDEHNIKYRS